MPCTLPDRTDMRNYQSLLQMTPELAAFRVQIDLEGLHMVSMVTCPKPYTLNPRPTWAFFEIAYGVCASEIMIGPRRVQRCTGEEHKLKRPLPLLGRSRLHLTHWHKLRASS